MIFKRKPEVQLYYWTLYGRVWSGKKWIEKNLIFSGELDHNEVELAYHHLTNYSANMGYDPVEVQLIGVESITFEEYSSIRKDLFVQLHSRMP